MKIVRVAPGSPAHRAGVRAGEDLFAIDGAPVRDSLELRFRASGEELTLTVGEEGKRRRRVNIIKDYDQELGLELASWRMHRCRNRCLFCFIDQLPAGLRRELYVKDGDFRLSFLHGNYITLTNLSEDDYRRIEEQGLSPLYISVHATEPGLRARLLGRRGSAEVMVHLKRLAGAGISFHTQFVLCPGVNDGAALERSLADLSRLGGGILSVALVPVGLTRHRRGLARLGRWTGARARRLLSRLKSWEEGGGSWGRRIHLADEFYLIAGEEIPPRARYGGYEQLENGVGLTRLLLERLKRVAGVELAPSPRPTRYLLATGTLASPILREHLAPILKRAPRTEAEIVPVRNRLLGSTVTVAGLLGGRDMLTTLRRRLQGPGRSENTVVLLPPFSVNRDGLLLDDLRPEELGRALRAPVMVAPFHPRDLLRRLGLWRTGRPRAPGTRPSPTSRGAS